MLSNPTFRKYFLPAFVFQSVVIGGAYGTGRELVEFFMSEGPIGGFLAILVSMAVFSAVSVVTFELARMWGAYDYRRFFQGLLGGGWWLFEICYVLLMLLILSVVAAAAGSTLEETFSVPFWIGVGLVMVAVAGIVFGGNKTIERFFSFWSLALYGLYIVFFVWCFRSFGGDIVANVGVESAGTDWVWAGFRYAGYNLAVIAPVLATLRIHEERKEAFVSGALCGPIAMIPALLWHFVAVAQYPEINDAAVPTNELLEALDARGFQVAFQVIFFGTLIETGSGLIHAFNERISGLRSADDQPLAAWIRPAVAIVLLGMASAMSSFGLIDLIAEGYGRLTLGFLAVYVLPVLTLGVWKLRNRTQTNHPPPPTS